MEETNQTDPTRAGQIAQKIVSLLTNEDSGTRQRAIHAALMLLGEKPLVEHRSEEQSKTRHDSSAATLELGQFFNRGDKLRPSDNTQLCAAYHYAIYGNAAFSLDEIRSIAKEAGVVLPNRLDMTLSSATHAGKKLFQPAGRGTVKPTAAAGVAFHERWGIRPGTRDKG
jgi:hypothetical protein